MLYSNELEWSKNASVRMSRRNHKVDTYIYTRGNHMKCT